MNARAEIGDDGVKLGQVEHKALRGFAQMKWSDDQSAVAFCDGDLHLGSGTEVEPPGFAIRVGFRPAITAKCPSWQNPIGLNLY